MIECCHSEPVRRLVRNDTFWVSVSVFQKITLAMDLPGGKMIFVKVYKLFSAGRFP